MAHGFTGEPSSAASITDGAAVLDYLHRFNDDIADFTERCRDSPLDWYDPEALHLDAALIGSGALLVYAERYDVDHDIAAKDLDLYTPAPEAQLREIEGTRYGVSSDVSPQVFSYDMSPDRDDTLSSGRPVVEIFTGFDWCDDAPDVEEAVRVLDETIADGAEPLVADPVTVYLPSPETLRATNPRRDAADDILAAVDGPA